MIIQLAGRVEARNNSAWSSSFAELCHSMHALILVACHILLTEASRWRLSVELVVFFFQFLFERMVPPLCFGGWELLLVQGGTCGHFPQQRLPVLTATCVER